MSKALALTPGAALLTRLWRMRGQDAPYLSDAGEEFDSEALVSFRANRDPRVYQDPRQSRKGERVKLHILVDCSGSMANNGRGAAARGLALMAAQSAVLAGIEVHPIAYGSSIYQLPVVRSLPHVQGLERYLRSYGYNLGSTHTHEALALAYQTALADPRAAHIVLVITDGSPDGVMIKEAGGGHSREHADGRWTVRAMVETLVDAGVETFGFMVSDDPSLANKVKTCFGPDRYAVAPNDHAAALALAAVVERFI
jgi:Mg-chelatase subunit ChlD